MSSRKSPRARLQLPQISPLVQLPHRRNLRGPQHEWSWCPGGVAAPAGVLCLILLVPARCERGSDHVLRQSCLAEALWFRRVRPRVGTRLPFAVHLGQQIPQVGENPRLRRPGTVPPGHRSAEPGRAVGDQSAGERPRLTPVHLAADHIGGQAEPGTPVVVERLAVLLDQVEEPEDSPNSTPECSIQARFMASNSSVSMSSITASASSSANSSSSVNAKSVAGSLRSRRMVPDLIDLYGGRVNVRPLWVYSNTSSRAGFLWSCGRLRVVDMAPPVRGQV